MRKAIIQRMEMFLHHGEPWFTLGITYLDDPELIYTIRLGSDAIPAHSKVGDIVVADSAGAVVVALRKP